MESIKSIYKIGVGPSSSHTMGPKLASEHFFKMQSGAHHYKVTLYGSLAATGKGHLTDQAILSSFPENKIDLIWKPGEVKTFHPNALCFEAFDSSGEKIKEWTAHSIGGGNVIDEEGNNLFPVKQIYRLSSMFDIISDCQKRGITFWEYVQEHEEQDLWPYLEQVWKVMKASVRRGIGKEGVLPGGLHIPRKANSYYIKAGNYKTSLKRRGLVYAYALAVSEENASGGEIVTAPTCGSCGVLPAILVLLQEVYKINDEKILRALATAALIGTLVKTNASISGAEVGCQGEIGVACSMASGAAAQLLGGTISQIEYAAEAGLEHHLGLTCDPVKGLVQVPCIERNAFAAARALDAGTYSMLSDGNHFISFDKVVETMNETGHDLPSLYRETSEGGLAKTMK